MMWSQMTAFNSRCYLVIFRYFYKYVNEKDKPTQEDRGVNILPDTIKCDSCVNKTAYYMKIRVLTWHN